MWAIRVIVLSFCVEVFTATVSSKEGQLKLVFAEQGSNVTLTCPSTSTGVKRSWYTGFHNMLTYSDKYLATNQRLLFDQSPSGSPNKVTDRDDIVLEEAGFRLSIIKLEPQHSGIYSCITNHTDEVTFDVIRVQVYKAVPNVTVVHVEEGGTVMLSCPSTVSGVARGWHRGASQQDTPYIMYNQTATGEVFSTLAFGSNFTVDRDDFSLTYTNVQFQDRGYFKCITHIPGAQAFSTVFLNVFRPVEVMEVAEFTSVVLASGIPVVGPWSAHWNHGRGVLFIGTQTYKTGSQHRYSMSLVGGSFDLRIGTVLLEDDTFISCVTSSSSSLVDSASIYRVQVYIEPSIIGLYDIEFNETDTVTMTCTIHRVYPQLSSSEFQMTWGDTVKQPVALANSDGSWSYTVSITKTLRVEDDQSMINCTAAPRLGRKSARIETISVWSPKATTIALPEDKTTKAALPKVPVKGTALRTSWSPAVPKLKPVIYGSAGSSTALPSSGKMNLMLIIGAVIGVVALLVIILIIILLCLRKSDKKNVPSMNRLSQKEYVNAAFHENDDLKHDI